MAKKQPSLLEALQLLGLGQQQEPPKPEPAPEPVGPPSPNPIQDLLRESIPAKEPFRPTISARKGELTHPYDSPPMNLKSLIDTMLKHGGSMDALRLGYNLLSDSEAGQDLGLRKPQEFQPPPPKPKQGAISGGPQGPTGQMPVELARQSAPTLGGKMREILPTRNELNVGGGAIDNEFIDPNLMRIQGRSMPLDPEIMKTLSEGQDAPPKAPAPTLEDIEIQELAKRAGEFKKPGLLEAIAVLANSVNPRQTPQGSMQFAQILRGEPERRSAEAMLSQLTQARGRRQAEEARQSGQFAIEGMRQGGASERAKIGAGARLGAAQIGQQGLIQRTGMQGQTARDVANIRANAPGRVTPGQRIDAAQFHALGRIQAEIGNVRKALEQSRASLDPNAQGQVPALTARLTELDNLKRDAVGMLHNAGAFSDEEAAMFMLGEGMESPDMSPEFLESLRTYRDQLNKLLPR